MNSQTRRAPGFLYRTKLQFSQNHSFSSDFQVNSSQSSFDQDFQLNPSESQFDQEQNTPIHSLQDDVEDYFETIKDPQEEEVLARKPIKVQKQQPNFSLPLSPNSNQLHDLKDCDRPKLAWAYDKHFRHNQKQSTLQTKSVSKSLDKKKLKQIPKRVFKNPEEQIINQEEFDSYDPESLPILTPEKQLAEPYFQYTYAEEPRQVLVDEEKDKIQKPVVNNSLLKQAKDNQLQEQEKVDMIRLLFDNAVHKNQSSQPLQQDYLQLQQPMKLFQPFKLIDFMPQSISLSVPKLIKQLLLLKHLQNCISLAAKSNKLHKSIQSHSSSVSKILQVTKQVSKQLQTIDVYQGIDGIFTTNSKIEQIKRFLVFQRFSIITIIYITVIDKFEQYKNYLLNLIKFLIQNHLVILNNIISSKTISAIIHRHYPLLIKKSLDLIKVNNDSINQVILKLSVVDDLFFSSLNKLGKRTATFTFAQIFKQFLEFLAFYLHKNSLQTKANSFSTPPSPFLKLSPSQYYLILDATQFSIKDKKGAFTFRPFHQNFLKQMSQHYDIINYSFLDPKQSKALMQKFDKNNLIKHKLYSHHFETWPQFRRCIEKIIFDSNNLIYLNCEQNDSHLERSVSLKKWKADKKDRELIDISPILISIPYMKLDCQKVTDAFRKCQKDIGKMQETLLPMLKKDKNHH